MRSRLAVLAVGLLILAQMGLSFQPRAFAADSPALWSNPSTWPAGVVPADGDLVTIPAGQSVLLDVSPPALAGIEIDGTLIFDEQDLRLETEWILVHGKLEIGTAASPHRSIAEIVLTDNSPGEDIHGMGDKVLGVMSGSLELHGQLRGPDWTRLMRTASAGDTELTLESPVNWQPGDRLVLASTDFDPQQAEEITVESVTRNVVTVDAPLNYMHWGEDQMYGDRVLSERAEVGLLSRNIVIHGDDASNEDGFGGHVMVMGGTARIDGVEFAAMGQAGQLARYPIHFHLLGDRPDAYVRNSSIHHSFNRCVTVHGTNDVLIEQNVAYSTFGHCFFMEDGAETGNRFISNLGILTMRPAEENRLLPSDESPATFWITNPANEFTGNVAAGSEAFGFWIALPEHPTGLSATDETDATVWLRRTPLLRFSDNTAHSNDSRGLHVDDGPTVDGETEVTVYEPHLDPIPPVEGEEDSSTITAVFDGFVAYKNRERGIWLRGVDHVVTNAVLADNAIGATFASYESYLENSLVVGESANTGTPYEGERTGAGGRTLPFPWEPDFPIRGYEFYDGIVGARDVTFAGFFPNLTRPASGLGFLLDDEFPLDPRNAVSGAVWLDESNRVYIRNAYPLADGSKTSVFRDLDGSVSGTAGAYIVAKASFLLTEDCNAVAAWNSAVCDHEYIGFSMENLDDEPATLRSMRLTREDGREVNLIGTPADTPYPRTSFYASVIDNQQLVVTPGDMPSQRLRLSLYGAADGSTLTVRIPVGSQDWSLYRDYDWSESGLMIQVSTLDELGLSESNAYFFDDKSGTVVVKLIVASGYGGTVVDLCANEGCG